LAWQNSFQRLPNRLPPRPPTSYDGVDSPKLKEKIRIRYLSITFAFACPCRRQSKNI
jgi:hypothetical protein